LSRKRYRSGMEAFHGPKPVTSWVLTWDAWGTCRNDERRGGWTRGGPRYSSVPHEILILGLEFDNRVFNVLCLTILFSRPIILLNILKEKGEVS
jgi:hypothetical protein